MRWWWGNIGSGKENEREGESVGHNQAEIRREKQRSGLKNMKQHLINCRRDNKLAHIHTADDTNATLRHYHSHPAHVANASALHQRYINALRELELERSTLEHL